MKSTGFRWCPQSPHQKHPLDSAPQYPMSGCYQGCSSYSTYDASWAQVSNTPFRLYKQNQHEGGISSPLIVHWPKGLKSKPGSITNQPGHLIDFMATFVELANATYPKKIGNRIVDPLEGKSLVPILNGDKRVGHNSIYFHFGTSDLYVMP